MKSPNRYVALLRGINVGGKNMLPMKQLAMIFEAAGCSDVETYIQSGNVVFKAEARIMRGLAAALFSQIEEQFGCKVPVVLRSVTELRAAVDNNPFLIAGSPAELLHVCFLADLPAAGLVAGLDAQRSPGDRFSVVGREIYMELPNGVGRTKLTNAYFDSKLKTVSTLRNWRTVLKLMEMLEA